CAAAARICASCVPSSVPPKTCATVASIAAATTMTATIATTTIAVVRSREAVDEHRRPTLAAPLPGGQRPPDGRLQPDGHAQRPCRRGVDPRRPLGRRFLARDQRRQ